MAQLDERLQAIANLVLEEVRGKEKPWVADIGCDHGQLTASVLERNPQIFVAASDVSAPSLEKARRLLAQKKLDARATLTVADGLSGIERTVDVIVMAGMGAETILSIIREGMDKIGQATLILQANVDLPTLRSGLAELEFAVCEEVYTLAAGRRYGTLLVRRGERRTLSVREALLGTASTGVQNESQRDYWLWQRSVRVREMEQIALRNSEKAKARLAENSEELNWMMEAVSMQSCDVQTLSGLVNGIAPYDLAEAWDNVGVLVGRKERTVTRVLTALDLSDGVLEEAKALGVQAIVTHHPVMMDARRRLTDADREGRLLLELAENGMALIAAHTNFDAAPGGVNDTLMARLGVRNVRGEGCVRVGEMPIEMTLGMLRDRAERQLHGPVRMYGAADTPVHTLGCCSGAGGSLWQEVAEKGADCLITGEVKHHVALDAVASGVCVLEAGHFETENPACEVMANALQNACDALKYNVTVFCSKGNPFGR